MSVNCVAPLVSAGQGELVRLTYAVDSKQLEDLLEALASVSFPINPQLYHRPQYVIVEFPAYTNTLPEVRATLASFGFAPGELKVMLAI